MSIMGHVSFDEQHEFHDGRFSYWVDGEWVTVELRDQAEGRGGTSKSFTMTREEFREFAEKTWEKARAMDGLSSSRRQL
jgi:hypothetical protein